MTRHPVALCFSVLTSSRLIETAALEAGTDEGEQRGRSHRVDGGVERGRGGDRSDRDDVAREKGDRHETCDARSRTAVEDFAYPEHGLQDRESSEKDPNVERG